MTEGMKHKRNLSENYIRKYGWQDSKKASPLYDTWRSMLKAAHLRTKPKMAVSTTGGFGITRYNKKGV